MPRPLALAGLVALVAACTPSAPPALGPGGSFVLTMAGEGASSSVADVASAGDLPASSGEGEAPTAGRTPRPSPTVSPETSPSPSPSPTATPRRSGGGGSRRPRPTPGPGLAIEVEDGGYDDPAAGEAAVVAP